MRIPIRPLFAVLVAAILGLLAHPPRAAAQTCISCGTPPTITITPFSGSWTGSASTTTQAVSVKFCQSTGGTAAPGDEFITLDGTPQSFSDGSVVSNCWTATGNVVLSAGTHTLTASVSNNAGSTSKSATYTYTIAITGGVAVTPDGATGRGTTSGGAEVFTVRNTDTQSHTYTLAAVCSGGTLASCAPGQASTTLAAGDSARVPVSHAGSGGTVYLKAWRSDATTARDSGWVNVSTGVAANEGLPNEAGSQTTVEKSMCVKLPAGSAIFECGDLRLVRALPGTRVLNRARQPMLVYSSQQAVPRQVVSTTVTNAGGTVNLTLQFTSGSTNTYTAQVTGTAQTTARVGISFDATGWATGIYDYTLSAAKVNADGSQTSLGSTPGTLAIVDGYNSSFGSGWSVAGLERIVPVSNSRLMWIDGDGSTRLYQQVSGSTTRWSFDGFDRPDTIVSQPSGGWKRVLPGGDTILFDFAGRDTAALNALGQRTAFRYDGVGKLTQIVLPGNGQTSSLTYDFSYNAAGVLQSVTAPTAVAGQSSSRITTFVPDANGRITKIISPDVRDTTILTYGDGTGHVTAITDARHFTTNYAYDGGGKLNAVTWTDPGTNTTATVTFAAAESRGLYNTSGIVATSAVKTTFNGPRTDVSDITTFEVNRFGAPTKITNALGAATTIVHGDPTYAALATQVTYPNGRKVTANYDAAGHLLAQTDWSMVSSDGRYATTTYDWDPKWESVTRVTLPEGETTYSGYDNYGRLSWMQPGSNSSRRTSITYNLPTAASAPGLPVSTTFPTVTGQSTTPVEQYDYDARGNVAGVTTALGYRTALLSDAAGQVLRMKRPVNQAQTLFQVDSTVYDVMGRATHTEAIGPAMNGAPEQRIRVDTNYDPGGLVLSVNRNTAEENITTSYRYDAAGRRVAEIAPDNTPSISTDNPVDSTFYDVAGNVRELHTRRYDPHTTTQRLVVRMDYDALNRMTRRITPAVQYDSTMAGIPTRLDEPYANACTLEWSTNGRAELLHSYPRYPNDGGCGFLVPADTATFTFDAVSGFMTKAENRTAWVHRSYFANGMVQVDSSYIRTFAGGGGASDLSTTPHKYGITYTYDLDGRRSTLRHPTQLATDRGVTRDLVSYTYDPATGALASVTDPLRNYFTFGYGWGGALETQTQAPKPDSAWATVLNYRYDIDGRLLTLQGNTNPFWTTNAYYLVNQTMAYDPRGKLLSLTNANGPVDTLVATYSGLGYLMTSNQAAYSTTIYGAVSTAQTQEAFTYSGLGNHVSSTTQLTHDVADGEVLHTFTAGSTSDTYDSYTGRQTQHFNGQARYDVFTYDRAGNQVFTDQTSNSSRSQGLENRVSYYAADGKLAGSDFRSITSVSDVSGPYTTVFEEYWYDALGRRVLVRARRFGEGVTASDEAKLSYARRTVWDGDAELWEITMPINSATSNGYDTWAENDTDTIPNKDWSFSGDSYVDPNRFWGRVAYTQGMETDHPLSVTRYGYGDEIRYGTTNYGFRNLAAFSIIPVWDAKGDAHRGTYGHGEFFTQCVPDINRCIDVAWPSLVFAYKRDQLKRTSWQGTLLEDKRDFSGTFFRRNRYYDPGNGRFTQEDPSGIAGGLNLYGFANGDPVNYGDPYGLCPVVRNGRVIPCSLLWGAAGMAAGAVGGAVVGGTGGVVACSPSGPVALACGAAGAAGGAETGGLAGGLLGTAAGWGADLAGTYGPELGRRAHELSSALQGWLYSRREQRMVRDALRAALGRNPTAEEIIEGGEIIHDAKEHGHGGTANDRNDFTFHEMVELFKNNF